VSRKDIRIGFAYDEPVPKNPEETVRSVAAEYEDARSIDWMRATLAEMGTVIDLPWGPDVVSRLANAHLDVIFNITEATGGRNRESLIPALAEACGVPCTGTDALGQGISLDKYLTKILARHVGVPTAGFAQVASLDQWDALAPTLVALRFPLFVKPTHGGSSMGILRTSRAETMDELYQAVRWILEHCADSALVEEFVFGREFTVGLLARPELELLPIGELIIEDGSPGAFYPYELKITHHRQFVCPADVPDELAAQLGDYARRVFGVLGCRDVARLDFRMGDDGVPYFLEINPIPGLTRYGSALPDLAQAAGITPEQVIHQLVRNALARKSQGEFANER
jgi:D-alanine-D-alanine ligase